MSHIQNIGRIIQECFSEIDRMRRQTRDVIVISYPKSGRTWLKFMLDSADVKVKYDHGGAEIRYGYTIEEIATRREQWASWRVIFMLRDPRDTVVSGYFQATRRQQEKNRFEGTMSEFMRSSRYGLAKIAAYNLSWLESASMFKDFTAVTYEGLHQDCAYDLARVVQFATERKPSGESVEQAVAAGSFENMRNIEAGLLGRMDDKLRLGGGQAGDPDSMKTRRGRVGGWQDYFGAPDIAYMERLLTELRYWERVQSIVPGLGPLGTPNNLICSI